MNAPLKAVCIAAGWPFCEEHGRPRYDGHNPCARLHDLPEPEHVYWCSWPNGECICPARAHSTETGTPDG